MRTKKIVYTALFIAIGILLPQVFHIIGGSDGGAIFLPMHIPVFIAGLMLGPLYGIITGLVCPLLSAIIVGMPGIEKLPFMMLELGIYGLSVGILYKKFNIYISLLLAMFFGRLGNLIAYFVLGNLLHMQGYTYTMAVTAIVKGAPGIVVQLIFIPLIVIACKKAVKDCV